MARFKTSFEEKARWMQDRVAPPSAIAGVPPSPSAVTERHYAVAEVAELWNLSTDAIRKLFQDEPGVLVIGSQSPHKRRYTTLRIPASVLQRVHRRMTKI